MKRFILPLLGIVAMMAALVPVTVSAAPAELHVDDDWQVGAPPYAEDTDGDNDFATIQAAVNAANPGDTIIVHEGIYNEAVRVTKSLTLEGGSGAIIKPDDMTPKHDNGIRRCGIYVAGIDAVTIEGFEIDGTAGTVHYGIYARDSDSTVVKNNVVHDITNEIASPGSDVAGVGILFFGWGQGIDGAHIEGNTVYNTGRMGIIVCGMQSTSPFKFLVCSNNVIRDNTVHHAWQGPTNDHGGAVQINGAKNAVIEGNTIYDTGLNQYGIYIAGSAASAPNQILRNDIHGNYVGIMIWSTAAEVDLSPYSPGAPEVHFNNIYNNADHGLKNLDTDPALKVDARYNWWGHASGPGGPHGSVNPAGKVMGKGDAVSANVNWNPWLPQPVTLTPLDPVPPGLLP